MSLFPRLDRHWQKIAGLLVVSIAAIIVFYPIFFLVQASLNVGDPQARPPEQYGLANFGGMLQYTNILTNTVVVSLVATAMALTFGFVMGWILSRTNVPGRQTFEQLMALPYYVTPLMGGPGLEPARITGGGIYQPDMARFRGSGTPDRHQYALWDRLGHGPI